MLPVVILTIAVVGIYYLGVSNMQFPTPKREDWTGWVWPVATWAGRKPTVSDYFQRWKTPDHRKHLGVDVTFAKTQAESKVPNLPNETRGFISPPGTPILAAGPGQVWEAGVDSYGHWVLLDHGTVGSAGGVTTRYAHLDKFARDWKRGDRVEAGTVLGTMGVPPNGGADAFRHLHFELRFPRAGVSQSDWVADPQPYMKLWGFK